MGYKASEIARKLKGAKMEKIHETLFRHGINLAETHPAKERNPTLQGAPPKEDWRLRNNPMDLVEDWNPPIFTGNDGVRLIHKVLEWAKQKGARNVE